MTSVTRCFDCGRQTNSDTGQVGIRKTAAGVVGFAGLTTCGRIWLCPVCNAKVMAKRAIEIGAMLTWAAVEGYHVIWGSLTVRHHQGDDLRDMIELQQAAWRHVSQSRTWSSVSSSTRVKHQHGPTCDGVEFSDGTEVAECTKVYEYVLKTGPDGKVLDGRIGYVRAAEITIGINGWHPHFHPIILWKGTVEEGNAFAEAVVDEWIAGVVKNGGDALKEGGQKLQVLTGLDVFSALSGYVTKAVFTDPRKLSLETVWSQGKLGNRRVKGTESHWSLLAGIEYGSVQDRRDWRNLEEATKGHRMIAWSRGLRSFAGLSEDEPTDEAVAAEEVGTKDDTVAVILPAGWETIGDNPQALADILDTLAAGTLADLVPVLDAWGVAWVSVDDAATVEWDFSDRDKAGDKSGHVDASSAPGRGTNDPRRRAFVR